MAIPEGYNTVSAYLIVSDAKEAMELYKQAFQAEGNACLTAPDGSVMHAELRIGNSSVMLSEENEQWQMKSPLTLGGSPVTMHLYVDDADAWYKRATDAGMETIQPPDDAFWGDRYCKVQDKFGHQWGIATQVRQLTEEELQFAANEWLQSMNPENA